MGMKPLLAVPQTKQLVAKPTVPATVVTVMSATPAPAGLFLGKDQVRARSDSGTSARASSGRMKERASNSSSSVIKSG